MAPPVNGLVGSIATTPTFFPRLRQKRRVRRKYEWVTGPLFPRYLFALFDYAARIREVYPNVLSIVREQQEGEGEIVNPGELRRLSDREIVGRFYAHVAGGLDEQELEVLTDVLDELNRRESGNPCAP